MKRSTLALTLGLTLVACSGQRNDTINQLGTGSRDGGSDADQEDEGEDAEAPADDAAEPAPQDADTASADTSVTGANDAGLDASGDANTSSDTGAPTDSGTDASDAGGGDANTGAQLRIRVPVITNAINFRPTVLFSDADGNVLSMHQTDATGLLVSDTAPAMVTVVLFGRASGIDQRTDVVSVVAPALGDEIVFEGPAVGPVGGGGDNPPPPANPYNLSLMNLPNGAYWADAYAGVEGCATGYLDLEAHATDPMPIQQDAACALEAQGSVLVFVHALSDALIGIASVSLPAAGATAQAITIDQWLTPEDLSVQLANIPANGTTDAALWLRKGKLRVRVDNPDSPPPGAYPFRVARSVVDSFDALAWFEHPATAPASVPNSHLMRKDRPANAPNIPFDLIDGLPEITSLNQVRTPVLQPSGSWTLAAATPADALSAHFSWGWRPNSDTWATVLWRVIAPPGTTQAKVPVLPAANGMFGLGIPNDAEVWFDGVEYYDSDAQNGYREFLREPLRVGGGGNEGNGRGSLDLWRDLPVGGTLRGVRGSNNRG